MQKRARAQVKKLLDKLKEHQETYIKYQIIAGYRYYIYFLNKKNKDPGLYNYLRGDTQSIDLPSGKKNNADANIGGRHINYLQNILDHGKSFDK